ncbi:MAG: hypothetical protein LBV74_16225 [Tannerella sp.]|jgi:hypothetical protein|nr:hypothetical protein [Tannerella sp.]
MMSNKREYLLFEDVQKNPSLQPYFDACVNAVLMISFFCLLNCKNKKAKSEIELPILVTDTIIIHYEIDSVYMLNKYVQQIVYVDRTDTLYIESDTFISPGLQRYWNIGELPDIYNIRTQTLSSPDSISESVKRQIKAIAAQTRNTYLANHIRLEALKNMSADSIHTQYFLISEQKLLIRKEESKACSPNKKPYSYMADKRYNRFLWKNDSNVEVLQYVWELTDKISGIKPVLWYDAKTKECIDGMLWELYRYHSIDPDNHYTKIIELPIPAFFDNTSLTDDELNSYGYHDIEHIVWSDFFFYKRDKERLMSLDMNDALSIIGCPVGAYIYKQNENTDVSKRYWNYRQEEFSDIVTPRICSPIFGTPSFQGRLDRSFKQTNIPDIIELTWLRSQNFYVTVYYIPQKGCWTPYDVAHWVDNAQYD